MRLESIIKSCVEEFLKENNKKLSDEGMNEVVDYVKQNIERDIDTHVSDVIEDYWEEGE